jgi:hypothetical protein
LRTEDNTDSTEKASNTRSFAGGQYLMVDMTKIKQAKSQAQGQIRAENKAAHRAGLHLEPEQGSDYMHACRQRHGNKARDRKASQHCMHVVHFLASGF